jgi:Raf kinase inhibitor-like YbhB/YbcL family protein
MILESDAFADGAKISSIHTCDGDDSSPPLRWREAPAGTATFALIVDDPDAPVGTWVHWVLFNLPGTTTELAERMSAARMLPSGALDGENSWGRLGYGGPCPPSGTHRYFFKLYAVDRSLDLASGATAAELARALQGRVLAESVLMGRYGRR